MGQLRSTQAWREQVRLLNERARSMHAEKATRISTSAMSEVLSALDDYWDAIEASDLSESAKGSYFDMAGNFVRWMRDDFVPGSRKFTGRMRDHERTQNASNNVRSTRRD
jgi:hypothetical protein